MTARRLSGFLLLTLTAGCGGSGSATSASPTTSSLSGIVFYDEDGDGTAGGHEQVRLPGVRVTAGSRGATTDAAGRFTIDGLTGGTAAVSIDTATLPPYFRPGPPPSVQLPTPAASAMAVPVALPIGAASRPNRYLGFGDSLTEGARGPGREAWPTPLESRLRGHFGAAEVHRNGIFGSRSIDGVERLAGVLASERPAFTLLLYGTNDWIRCRDAAPADCYTIDALRQMIQMARDAGSLPVLATIPPVNPDYPDLGAADRNAWIREQNELIRTLAGQEDVPLAEVWAAFGADEGSWPTLFVDHAHPNEVGYDRIAGAFFDALTRPRGR